MLRILTAAVVAVFGAAAAFAFRFRRDALLPRSPGRDLGASVNGLDDTTISLIDHGSRPAVDHPGTLGLWWAGGYGQVRDILSTDGDHSTRRFTPTSGVVPPVGHVVDLESYAFPTDPGDVGLRFFEVGFAAPLGELGAWVVPADGGTTWAIHIHGWSAERREAIRTLSSYYRTGITSMVIDYRNDPGAPTDPTGHYRFGLSEWEDVEAALQYAMTHGAERVVLSGFSTGAAAAMALMERSEMASHVVGLVFDSPNIEMSETVKAEADRLMVPVAIRRLAMWLANTLWDVDWEGIDYVNRAAAIAVPVLVFHGQEDDRVPVEVSRRLKHSNPGMVTLIETEKAIHVMSWNVDPESYESELEVFLRSL